jgi:MoxR-like ATPase
MTPQGVPDPPNPLQARDRILKVEQALNNIIIGHDDMIKGLILALVAGEHVVFIGPPGIAKTMLVRSAANLLRGKYYMSLLTRFTTFDDVFGPVDIVKLTKGEYARRWSGIINADIVFLDEVFNANAAVLQSLLSLMNERVIYDPQSGQIIETPLWSLIGASNRVPEEDELQALYDRFAIRVFPDYIRDDATLKVALEARWLNKAGLEPIASMDDVKVLNAFAMSILPVTVEELRKTVLDVYFTRVSPIVQTLRSKGVLISDRTVIEKLTKIYASYIVLYGLDGNGGINADVLFSAVYHILPFTARTPSEKSEIDKAISEGLGELGELAKKVQKAKELLATRNFAAYAEAEKILEEVINDKDLVERIAQKAPWLRIEAEAQLKMARELLERIRKVKEAIQF